jgi:hypothetical protein
MSKHRKSTSSAGASPASRSRTRAGGRAPKTTAGSGLSLCESYAQLDPDGSWLKMYQDSFQLKLDGSSVECSGTWPRAGTMRNGTAYRRQPLVRRTRGIGSSLWPTPIVHDAVTSGFTPEQIAKSAEERQDSLTRAVAMWPTPTQADGLGGPGSSGREGGENLRTQVGGQLNADWVSLLMGFPTDWTVMDGSAECPE